MHNEVWGCAETLPKVALTESLKEDSRWNGKNKATNCL